MLLVVVHLEGGPNGVALGGVVIVPPCCFASKAGLARTTRRPGDVLLEDVRGLLLEEASVLLVQGDVVVTRLWEI